MCRQIIKKPIEETISTGIEVHTKESVVNYESYIRKVMRVVKKIINYLLQVANRKMD